MEAQGKYKSRQQTGRPGKTVGSVSMYHCCVLSGRRIITSRAYISVLLQRYIQVLLVKFLSIQVIGIKTRYFRAASFVGYVWRGQTFFPVKGAIQW